jgi:hypothetical protein
MKNLKATPSYYFMKLDKNEILEFDMPWHVATLVKKRIMRLNYYW